MSILCCILQFIRFMQTALLLCNKEYLASKIKIWYCPGIGLEGPRKTSYGYPAFTSVLRNVLGLSCYLSDWGSDSLSSFHREWTKPQQEISSNNRREKRDFLLLKLINNPSLRASPNPNLYTSFLMFQSRYQAHFNTVVNMDCFKLENLFFSAISKKMREKVQ